MANLSRLLPTFIGTGAVDLFAEEDVQYAIRLMAAGVPVELFVVPGAYHAFDLIATHAKLTQEFRAVQLGRCAFAASHFRMSGPIFDDGLCRPV